MSVPKLIILIVLLILVVGALSIWINDLIASAKSLRLFQAEERQERMRIDRIIADIKRRRTNHAPQVGADGEKEHDDGN